MFNFDGTTFVIQYPSGRWGFVGAVPIELAYTNPDGSPLDAETAKAVATFGPGLFTFSKKIKAVSFASQEAAEDAATALGYTAVEPGSPGKGRKKLPAVVA